MPRLPNLDDYDGNYSDDDSADCPIRRFEREDDEDLIEEEEEEEDEEE